MSIIDQNKGQIIGKQASQLINKIQNDLSYGVKILGNEINHNDVIRVWTSTNENTFGIVATSSSRFHNNINYIEVQSFKYPPYFKLSVINRSSDNNDQLEIHFYKLNENFLEINEVVDNDIIKKFIDDYIQSKPNLHLTKHNFEKYAYNKNQYQWLRPELYVE